jgi:hypothetical protein
MASKSGKSGTECKTSYLKAFFGTDKSVAFISSQKSPWLKIAYAFVKVYVGWLYAHIYMLLGLG